MPSIELILYVSGSSPSSSRAVRNLRRLLASYEPEQVKLTVCDLSVEFSREAVEDRIAFAPTLVKRLPAPKAWILGSLDDERPVVNLLDDARVKRKS